GAVIDDALGDEVRGTVIAAGFDRTTEQANADPGRGLGGAGASADGRVCAPPKGGRRSSAGPSAAPATTAMTPSWTSPPSSSADQQPPEEPGAAGAARVAAMSEERAGSPGPVRRDRPGPAGLVWRPGPPEAVGPDPAWPPGLVAEGRLQ